MFRVLAIAVMLASPLMSGCARDVFAPAAVAPTRTVTKFVDRERQVSVPACPSDDEIAETIYAASKSVYLQHAALRGQTGACACDGDKYGPARIICGSPEAGAIKVAKWGYCKRGKPITPEMLAEARSKFAACRKS